MSDGFTDWTDEELELRDQIDEMTHEDVCRLWRFAKIGSRFFTGRVGVYFFQRFKILGGMTPEISKKIGFNDE